MIDADVPTLPFVALRQNNPPLESDLQLTEDVVGYPLIIKPSVSYGSMMISTKSVVDTPQQLLSYLAEDALADYTDEIFLEAFLGGREFTVLCSGDQEVGVRVYIAAERVFDKKLKEREKILTFDICRSCALIRLSTMIGWDGCDLNSNTTGEVPVQPYWYEAAPEHFQVYLQGKVMTIIHF